MDNKPIWAVESGNEIMHIHADGAISRPALRTIAANYAGPSGQWTVCGAVERNNFGAVVRRYSLVEVLALGSALPWRFKNGKQRTFLQDIDHGTLREWCSPVHRICWRISA